MPGLGATDPADLEAQACAELGFSRQLEHPRRMSPYPGVGGHPAPPLPLPTVTTTTTTTSSEVTKSLQYLACTTLALLSGNEEAASSLSDGAMQKKHVLTQVFRAYDNCGSGTLSSDEAGALFADLARSMVILRLVILEDGDKVDTTGMTRKNWNKQSNTLSLIGLGRSADVSAYFIPELGIALDAGMHVSSLGSIRWVIK
jgi:hypothetical protein